MFFIKSNMTNKNFAAEILIFIQIHVLNVSSSEEYILQALSFKIMQIAIPEVIIADYANFMTKN